MTAPVSRYNVPIPTRMPELRGQLPGLLTAEQLLAPRRAYTGDKPEQPNDFSLGNIGSNIIDILSRGTYASAGFSKQLIKNLRGPEERGNPFAEALKGLTAETTNTYSDVIEEYDPNAHGAVKFIGGLAGDILLDPSNLVFGGVTAGVRAGIKAAKAPAELAKAAERATNAAAAPLTNAEIKAMPKVPLNVRATADTNSRLGKMLDPVKKKFVQGHGFEDLNELYRPMVNRAEDTVSKYTKQLKEINKLHNAQDIQDGFSAWKRGVPPVDPDALVAYDKLIPGINRFADVKNDPFIASYLSDPRKLEALHEAMRVKGVGFKFDTKKAMTNRNTGTAVKPKIVRSIDPDKMAAQMRDWDIKDPLEFMDRMHQAVTHIKVLDATGTSLAKLGKTTARPGMSKISQTKGTILGPFLPKDVYFEHDIARKITRMEDFFQQPTSFKGQKGPLASLVNSVVTPAMNIWKPYMTIANPSHHTKNTLSDIILNSMDGMNNVGAYYKSKKMLQAGGAVEKMGIPGIKELESGIGVSGAKRMSTIRLKGSNVDVSADQMFKDGWNQGLFVNHHGTEDVLESAGRGASGTTGAKTGKTKKTPTSVLLDNAWMRTGARVSEYTNHYTRGAHFIGLLENKKFTRQFATKEEAVAAAATRVKKWHPDLQGLTPWERKNARLAVTFYNWQRQVLPMVLNTAISKPGRITGIPKANYEVAKAMGLNPESISEQFDENGIFPSFVHENILGPVANTGWGQLGISAGTPQEAFFGDLLNGNPVKTAYKNINPLAQGIIEGLTGVDPATGKPIINKSDWLDAQIPGIDKVARLSGYSPSSIITKLAQGDIGIDEIAAKQRGTFNQPMRGLNWLTGLGLTDYQNNTYRNLAKKEEKGDS